MPSRALERALHWLDQELDDPGLLRFRSVFGLVWLAYDALDLLCSGTATMSFWPSGVLGAPPLLRVLQVGLIVCGAAMVRGSWAVAAPLTAAALRGLEAYEFLRLNDFYYYIVVALLLSRVPPGSGWRRRAPGTMGGDPTCLPALPVRAPRWVRDALRWQTAWIYLATGTLKLNPAWLSGGHLYVRQAYLAAVLRWPYPGPVARALSHLPVDAGLAWVAAISEIVLGVLIVAGRPRALVVALAVAIHAFGALAMNVWFFGASMVAQVVLLLPRPAPSASSPRRSALIRTPAPSPRP